jgi:hypothetical protein
MPVKNVAGAAERLLTISVDGYSPGHNRPGQCCRWVYYAIGAEPNITPLPSAAAGWAAAPAASKHPIPADTPVPKDMVVYLGATAGPRWAGDVNYPYGDYCISTGQGVGLDTVVACTDSLVGVGVIGHMTIRQRIAETGRGVEGYQTNFGGWDITTGAVTAQAVTATASTSIEQEEDMNPTIITDGKTGQLLAAFGVVFKYTKPAQVSADLKSGIPVKKIPTNLYAELSSIAQSK